ncbi:hypothetical protein RB620_10985 [Paenibacillus sp. LHD-117]|uniref:hypothetical protein n=1 Tax=Paenibacillus sp. LHD-117 TaxID=3071412 RepID=UPI0027DF0851|nr:hypothetical protein [Paenibacillus sp. LHD-117]MDQ6419959.1 hypothetical protein [Paenibacillus sp. LHD-117]
MFVFSKKSALTVLAVLSFVLMTACSSTPETSVDPANVDVSVTTNPSPAQPNSKVRLSGQFTGIELNKSATVSFEIRKGDKSEFIDAVYEGDNIFEADYTFTQSGINEVFVHLYTGDLHVTKKKPVEIQ